MKESCQLQSCCLTDWKRATGTHCVVMDDSARFAVLSSALKETPCILNGKNAKLLC